MSNTRIDNADEPEYSPISYRPGEVDLLSMDSFSQIPRELFDRLLGCAYGQALGDAYGLSTEFENRHQIQHNYPDHSKLIPFPDYIRNTHSKRWARGDWTDDTDQWILILDTLINENGDERKFAGKLYTWIEKGYPELNDYAGMGLGANVSQVNLVFFVATLKFTS
jgi:ADP-ribosylglycohydrolase